ncbi:MAG: CAP domain-containing protein [Gemmatimonadales bacterium]
MQATSPTAVTDENVARETMLTATRYVLRAALLMLLYVAPALAAQTPTSLERGVLAETNLARTNPNAYADILERRLAWFDGSVIRRPGASVGIRTNEGPQAVREAIAFLRRQPPLLPLEWSHGLWRAARDHAEDQGPTGQTGHDGTDGSRMDERMSRYGRWQSTAAENIDYGSDDPRDIVVNLIIDDGVTGRGHRRNIFNEDLRVAGVGCGPHQRYRAMCVIDYAGGYDDTNTSDSLNRRGETGKPGRNE